MPRMSAEDERQFRNTIVTGRQIRDEGVVPVISSVTHTKIPHVIRRDFNYGLVLAN